MIYLSEKGFLSVILDKLIMPAGFLASLHVWSTKKLIHPEVVQHVGVDIYHEKGAGSSDTDLYWDLKKKWSQARGLPWYPSNKGRDKIREVLGELEELLETYYIVHVKWRNSRSFQVSFQ